MSRNSQPRHDLLIEKHYSSDYNVGENTIFTGGSTASYLLLPVIPTA
jgi:predicted acyl esterase